MKYTLKNLKYLVFTLTFVIVGFAFSNSTHASTYSYSCSDGGTITSTVDISPAGPFSSGNTTSFDVSASMQSFSCGTREVNLTAQNNSGVTHTIIPNQTLNQNGFIPPVIDSVNFAAPSSAGTYAVHFITGVDEPALSIIIENQSLATTLTTFYINSVEPSPLTGGGLPVPPSSSRLGYMDLDGLGNIYIEWNLPPGNPGGHISVTDTNGVQIVECSVQQDGDPDPSFEWKDVDLSGNEPLMIDITDGEYCP